MKQLLDLNLNESCEIDHKTENTNLGMCKVPKS